MLAIGGRGVARENKIDKKKKNSCSHENLPK